MGISIHGVYRAEAEREAAFYLIKSNGGKIYIEGEVEVKTYISEYDENRISYTYFPKKNYFEI